MCFTTISHRPACAASRNVPGPIRHCGAEPAAPAIDAEGDRV